MDFRTGGGIAMRKPKKLRKLIKAAKMGKPCAMYRLGICFETGTMTEKDLTKAADWISAAAEAGYAPALDWIKDYSFDDDALIQAES
ncbi:hypothetical protein [Pseudoruminococcus massiliensis]|uniref:hypothetical protein n=1 Tax=Pseudoruminococcus massiliensis TaxID=2086583 RepID=UPI003AB4A387